MELIVIIPATVEVELFQVVPVALMPMYALEHLVDLGRSARISMGEPFVSAEKGS